MRIREAREALGWSQERLATAIGTTQQTVQRWESGVTDPKGSQIKAISKAMGVTVSFLMGMDEPGSDEVGLTYDERDLLNLYRNMDDMHKSTLMDTARAFSALSEKDGSVGYGVVSIGTLDAVSGRS